MCGSADVATANAVIKLQFIRLNIFQPNPIPNPNSNFIPNPNLNHILNHSPNSVATSADPHIRRFAFYHRPVVKAVIYMHSTIVAGNIATQTLKIY